MVADPVFQIIGIVGVARPILAGNIAIILGALIGVFDHHRDRSAGRHQHIAVFDEAGQHFHLIRFAALRDESGLSWLAAVKLGLNVGGGEADAGRTAVHHAAERGSMAFAPGRNPEEMAERVVRH